MDVGKRHVVTWWSNETGTDMKQLDEYDTVGYKKIQVHLIYDVKYFRCHMTRLVAGGHLTHIPVEIVYYGFVYLHSTWLILFLDELNKIKHGLNILEFHTFRQLKLRKFTS